MVNCYSNLSFNAAVASSDSIHTQLILFVVVLITIAIDNYSKF